MANKNPTIYLLKFYTNISIKMFIFICSIRKKVATKWYNPISRHVSNTGHSWFLLDTLFWLPETPCLGFSPLIGLSPTSSPCLWILEGPRPSIQLLGHLFYPHSELSRWACQSCGLNDLLLDSQISISRPASSLNSKLGYPAGHSTSPSVLD